MGTRALKSSQHSKRTRPATSSGESFHAKGVSAAAEGKHDLAAALFAQAIQLSGPRAPYCHSLARSLHASGRYRQAAVCYQQAMVREPENIHLHLGLARALFQENRIGETVAVLRDALAGKPNVAEGWALLGNALSHADRYELAREALDRAISLDPTQPGFHYDLGLVLSRTGESQEAEASYRRALQLRARFPEALNNLGNLLRRRKATPQAVDCYQQALKFRPGYLDATYNLGLALQDLDLLEDAAGCYGAVLKEKPEHHASLNNLANVLLRGGRVDEALARYDEAVRLSPDSREYRVNLGMAQLLDGDFPSGWRNYGARRAPVRSDLTLWNGEPVEGRGILLLSEQGLGDTIQFIRYARRLHHEGGRVSALCPESLAELLRTAPGLENVIVSGQQVSHCDWYAPLMHLPRLFDTRLESIPADTPYLFADPERVRQWELELNIPPSQFKVGLAWRGAAEHWNDRNRSIDPAELGALGELPDTAWISLQKGFPQGCESLSFTPLPRDLEDFADTAALMAHLDLVISVDTSVAHLAGALARPVWTLLPFAPDWRWLRDRNDSPWYPNMTLFRQERRGEWKPVLEEVREELARIRSVKQ
ncbi:MAG TPA: tetratricopeptide repeat protein [Bryobacteraceae bacterium]|nr:tetratricopeptide repeat protein [Bryobacteraceae bacterium]